MQTKTNNEYIKYYKDKDLEISFSIYPVVKDIIILPEMSKQETKQELKKPFILTKGFWVFVTFRGEKYRFFIPTGYRYNGADIPFGLYNLIGSPSTPQFKIASLLHDFICEHHNVIGYNRYLSTKIFDALLEVANVPRWKRFLMFHCVDNWQKFCGWGLAENSFAGLD